MPTPTTEVRRPMPGGGSSTSPRRSGSSWRSARQLPMALRGTGALFAPGASAGRDQSALVAMDDAISACGAVVSRMDFPYRRAGRRAPDREPVLLDAVREEAAGLAARAGLPPER